MILKKKKTQNTKTNQHTNKRKIIRKLQLKKNKFLFELNCKINSFCFIDFKDFLFSCLIFFGKSQTHRFRFHFVVEKILEKEEYLYLNFQCGFFFFLKSFQQLHSISFEKTKMTSNCSCFKLTSSFRLKIEFK